MKARAARKLVKAEIIKQADQYFRQLPFDSAGHKHCKTAAGQKIVQLARTRLGYSSSTYDGDIFWTFFTTWRDAERKKRTAGFINMNKHTR